MVLFLPHLLTAKGQEDREKKNKRQDMGPIQNKMKKRESCCAADFGQGTRDKNGTEKRGADQP